MIQSISVNGETHQIDYTTLANKPVIPVIPSVTSADQGKVLTVNSEGEWYAANVPSELPSASLSAAGKSLVVDGYGNWAISSLNYGEQISNLQRDLDDYTTATSPRLLPFGESSADEGKILICNGYSWDFSDFTMPALQGQISNLQRDLDDYTTATSPRLLPFGGSLADEGKILIYDGHSWDFSDFTMPALQGQINRLETQLSQLQERVSRLASSLSDTEAYATNETLALSGAGVSVSGEKLSIDDTAANVTGEKLSIA